MNAEEVALNLWNKLREPISGMPSEMKAAELDDMKEALTQFAERRYLDGRREGQERLKALLDLKYKTARSEALEEAAQVLADKNCGSRFNEEIKEIRALKDGGKK